MSKIDGHWYHPPGQQKWWEFVLKCPRLWDNFPAGEFTGGELWALQKSMKALPRYQQREDFTWAFCLRHQANGTLTTPGVLNQCSPPNQHREESNPKTDPWSTTKEWISLTSATLGTSVGSSRKTPQVIHTETFHNLLLVMQHSKTTVLLCGWHRFRITAGILPFQTLRSFGLGWRGMDRKLSCYLNEKLRIWISLSRMAMLMVEGDRERKIKESKRTPELRLPQGVRKQN